MDTELIIRYNTCVLCSEQIVKPRQICCKKCLKAKSSKVSNGRVFKMKLNKNTNTFSEALNVTHNYLGN
jgi:predicted nucleic acid-binding Zn ribbon protein